MSQPPSLFYPQPNDPRMLCDRFMGALGPIPLLVLLPANFLESILPVYRASFALMKLEEKPCSQIAFLNDKQSTFIIQFSVILPFQGDPGPQGPPGSQGPRGNPVSKKSSVMIYCQIVIIMIWNCIYFIVMICVISFTEFLWLF